MVNRMTMSEKRALVAKMANGVLFDQGLTMS